MLQNAYLVAKIGADTAENEQHFAEILPIGRRAAGADRSNAAVRLLEKTTARLGDNVRYQSFSRSFQVGGL